MRMTASKYGKYSWLIIVCFKIPKDGQIAASLYGTGSTNIFGTESIKVPQPVAQLALQDQQSPSTCCVPVEWD